MISSTCLNIATDQHYPNGESKRSENGHPAPYNLKYIEIGNENGWETAIEYNPTVCHDTRLNISSLS